MTKALDSEKQQSAKFADSGQPVQDASQSSHSQNGFFSIFKDLPNGIFAVSLFGLFLGLSTTMVYSQLPLFLTEEIHTTRATVAFIDGLVEFLAYFTRVFAGLMSDFLKDRKLILFLGCILTFLIKPMLAFAKTSTMVVLVQSIERIGNGLQATPRDALIADLSNRNTRGRSYGFTKSLKTIGALVGTPIAVWLMIKTNNDYRTVFLCATIPVAIAILCLFKVKTPQELNVKETQAKKIKPENPFKRKYLKSLDRSFWKILLLAFVFELGHFSEHMFPLYAKHFSSVTFAGFTGMFVSIGQVLLSFPIGLMADKFGKGRFIKICVILMIVANLLFLSAQYSGLSPVAYVFAGSLLWGGQMTAVQGLFLALISEQVSFHLRATAIGLYYCSVGVAYFIASNVAGNIWDHLGSSWAFLYSIFFCCATLILAKVLLPKKYEHGYENSL